MILKRIKLKNRKEVIGYIFSSSEQPKRNYSKESDDETIRLKSKWRKINHV